MTKLDVRNLTISFRTNNGAVRAVRDVSFTLNEGETLAIVGESGSGKSVTTRAVMGILAANAMVDNGEIIYDGKDLLKIPEEDFHTLRGHKLSMIFQDPLSALNPIMRIGNQLTEAMLLNNKERRQDGKKRYDAMRAQLEKAMLKANPAQADAIRESAKHFDAFVLAGIKFENEYNLVHDSITEAGDCIEECRLDLIKKDEKAVRETSARLIKALEGIYHSYLIPANDENAKSLVRNVSALGKKFSLLDADKYTDALGTLKARLDEALALPEPDFFSIGYRLSQGGSFDPAQKSISEINDEAAAELNKQFLAGFKKNIADAVAQSDADAAAARPAIVQELRGLVGVFEETPLDARKVKAAIEKAAAAAERGIDPLDTEKKNPAYFFRSSMNANSQRYFRGLTYNPREEKRFERETQKHDALVAKGKLAASVAPKNLINLEIAQKNLVNTMRDMIAYYESLSGQHIDCAARAEGMIAYLKARSSESAYVLTKSMAKHRAIELMDEVGIPEPYKRYEQYPFEFSGGMRQRIVIAIALSANPDILICDEPTTALDVTIQAQILELINRLKKQRKLSIIFITHDLGVVANMADHIAIMYAGKIVEYGTADDVFYDPRHPYTWALLSSMPDLETKEKLEAIPGTPPNMILPPKGDAFAARNKYALQIDFEEQPPMFRVSDTHTAATWLLHPNAPKVEPPLIVRERIQRMLRQNPENGKGGTQA